MVLESFHPTVRRWFETEVGTPTPPKYLALSDMNNCTPAQLQGFAGKVRATMEEL